MNTVPVGSMARGDWRELRRLRVLALYRAGWLQTRIAEALGITKGYVSKLVKRVRDLPEDRQAEALKIAKHPGPKPRYTAEHTKQIVAIVDRGAESFGLTSAAWTLRTLRQVIHRELGIWVGKSWLAQTLHKEGYSCQKPDTLAKERNDKAVAGFRGGGWSSLKRGR